MVIDKAHRAYRLMVSNERTYRFMDRVAEQLGEHERARDVLSDDATYRLAVDSLTQQHARMLPDGEVR